MASRRRRARATTFEHYCRQLPWPLVVLLAAVAAALTFAGLVYLSCPAWLDFGPLRALKPALCPPLPFATFGAFLWLGLGLLGAYRNYRHQQLRRRLVQRAKNLADLQALSWQHFELLVGQLYRQYGYHVRETGRGGADGGVDLVAEKWGSGEKVIVQCKHYRATSVGVSVVRELYGLMVHHKATGAAIVCCGQFTSAAHAFAEGKPLVLVGADKLLHGLARIRKSSPTTSHA